MKEESSEINFEKYFALLRFSTFKTGQKKRDEGMWRNLQLKSWSWIKGLDRNVFLILTDLP
jgi:hypothetical protein